MRIGSKCVTSSISGLLLILFGCHCSLIATLSFKQAPKNGVTGKHILNLANIICSFQCLPFPL